MLPTSRVLSALVLGLGVTGVSAGMTAPHFLTAEPVLPLDLNNLTYTLHDDEATTRLIQDGRQLNVPVTAQWHVTLQEPADADSVTVRVGTSWMRGSQQEESERLIDAKVWSYPMDRLDGQALGPATLTHTLGTPTSEVPVGALWWKFPANTAKTSYDVFDETLRKPYPAVFEEELEMEGRTVYRFHQSIPAENVAMSYAGNTVPNPNQEEGGQLYLFHSAQRDFYVDAHTGLIVDMDLTQKDFYGTLEGQERENVLDFSGSMSEEDTATLLADAATFHNSPVLRAIRWGLLGAGAVLILLGALGIFGAFGRRKP